MKSLTLLLALAFLGAAFAHQGVGRPQVAQPVFRGVLPKPPQYVPLETIMALTPSVPIGRSGALSATFPVLFSPYEGIKFEFGMIQSSPTVGGLTVAFLSAKGVRSYTVAFTVDIEYPNDPQQTHNWELQYEGRVHSNPMKSGRTKAVIVLKGAAEQMLSARLRCVGVPVKWSVISVVVQKTPQAIGGGG